MLPFKLTIPCGPHDLALIVVVSIQATVLAYLREPRWKAGIFSLPIPFTMATMAVGRPVGASNVLALVVLFLYGQGVRVLHQRFRVPIVPAILLAAAGYILLGGFLAAIVPDTDDAFWIACAATLAMGLWLFRQFPPRDEPAYRSPLPIGLKLLIMAAIIFFVLTLKNLLQGFLTLFPMIGTLGAYEARHSLWTFGRQFPVVMITLTPMMAACRLAQSHIGLEAALAAGWAVFVVVFLPFTWNDWKTR